MASTQIYPIKKTPELALRYIQNPTKTTWLNTNLVTGINCSPKLASIQFAMTREFYNKTTGNLAYHVTQNFKPGETDGETAHKIGVKFANKFLDNKFQAVVATHTDKAHIHNHIIFCSVSHIDGKKYYDTLSSYKRLRKISDELCKEYDLSIIKPKNKGKSYKEWYELKQGNSWKQKIKTAIDSAINEANSYLEFIKILKTNGYSVKEGKHISFRHKDYKRFVRGKSLGADYTKESILSLIALKKLGLKVLKLNVNNNIKIYKLQKITVTKKYFKKNTNYLKINLLLGIKIIKSLIYKTNKIDNFQNKKIILDYNNALLERLFNQIKFIEKNNINTYEHLIDLIKKNQNNLANLKVLLKDNSIKVNKLSNIITEIDTYEKNQKLLTKKFFKIDKKTLEFKSYINSKNKLDKLKIKTKEDIEKIKSDYKIILKSYNKIKLEYNSKKKLHSIYNETSDTINKITSRKYPYSNISKNYSNNQVTQKINRNEIEREE